MVLRVPKINPPVFGSVVDPVDGYNPVAYLAKDSFVLNTSIAYIDRFGQQWSDNTFAVGFSNVATMKVSCVGGLNIYVGYDVSLKNAAKKVRKIVRLSKKLGINKAVISKCHTIFYMNNPTSHHLTLNGKRGRKWCSGEYISSKVGFLGKIPPDFREY